MSDKQKGLQSVLGEILPRIEHRNCVQHIYINFKIYHGSQFLRNKFWTCARASTMAFKKVDPTAFDWIEKNAGNPKYWCKAFFSLEVKSDMLCNNLNEFFNSFILSARDKPIITMFERIRRLIMERIKDRKFLVGCKPGPLCSRISRILEKRTAYEDGYTYSWNGVDGFEVYSYSGDHFKVNLRKKECSCRI
ncbi:hypothetical protein LIER_12427 [Lithospermum erythrorhizon]|uniref:Uncharacterized protein n=1 Tax=Lithospermum erythrorhizon TaxID=34254 RepID=A0AAV3PWX5_LITER